jgi:hypothetical protein
MVDHGMKEVYISLIASHIIKTNELHYSCNKIFDKVGEERRLGKIVVRQPSCFTLKLLIDWVVHRCWLVPMDHTL